MAAENGKNRTLNGAWSKRATGPQLVDGIWSESVREGTTIGNVRGSDHGKRDARATFTFVMKRVADPLTFHVACPFERSVENPFAPEEE